MSVALRLPKRVTDTKLAAIAREIAMSFHDLEDILKVHEISQHEWEKIQRHPLFIEYLQSEIIAWQSAVNTEQRVKYKSAALIEVWLQHASDRLHDTRETLASKVELAKLIARLAGMGLTGANVSGDVGEKISININLGGSDQPIKIVKEVTQQGNLIEHERGDAV